MFYRLQRYKQVLNKQTNKHTIIATNAITIDAANATYKPKINVGYSIIILI